jgi:uncharacterized protein YaiL (DUF2058 family)
MPSSDTVAAEQRAVFERAVAKQQQVERERELRRRQQAEARFVASVKDYDASVKTVVQSASGPSWGRFYHFSGA